MIGVMMDMTAERAREAELSMALKAQEQLLSEVNHRVKNSLQLVVSTLRLQARRLENPVVLQAFDEAIFRVRAIISVHERLYRTQNSLTVDMSDHITKLCLDIAGSTKARRIEVTADEISLPTERAIPISVILNELLSSPMRNALKEGAAVHVSLREIAGGLMELEVSDAAQGTLSDLSLKLVNSMASQIDGTFRQSEGAIYKATVMFPKERD